MQTILFSMPFSRLFAIFFVSFLKQCDSKDGFMGTPRAFSIQPINPHIRFSSTSSIPKELDYRIDIENGGKTNVHLVRNTRQEIPQAFIQHQDGTLVQQHLPHQNVTFYTDVNGLAAAACMLSSDGHVIFSNAVVQTSGETCVLGETSGFADCIPEFGYSVADIVVEQSVNTSNGGRYRRQTSIEKYVELAFLLDAKITTIFYARHPGDNAAAEAEMVVVYTLIANEMNVIFSSIKTASGNLLDLYVYPSAVIYPGYQLNYPWSESYNDGTDLNFGTAANDNLLFVVNSGVITQQCDFAIAVTGFRINKLFGSATGYTKGFTFQDVVCKSVDTRYALIEYRETNPARLASHLLGHALGAVHDGDNNACADNTFMMASTYFSATSSSATTFLSFSSCSALAINTYLQSQTDCTGSGNGFSDEDFLEFYCGGLPGKYNASLDLQCQSYTHNYASVACDNATIASCYEAGVVRCTSSGGACNQTLDFVWAGTTCDTGKICYKGSCVDSFSLCTTTSTTSTTTSTTSTTTSTTSTTTSTTSTTTSTTSTSTTSTTTSTTSTSTSSTTTSTTSTTTSTTSTSTTSTTTSTTSSTTSTSSTTTSSTSTTTTEMPLAPCNCCFFLPNKSKKRNCCARKRKKFKADCYCCGSLRGVYPPSRV